MAGLNSVGFSSNDGEVDLESLRERLRKNDRPRATTVRASCKIHVLTGCILRATAPSGVRSPVGGGQSGVESS
jgi:hypothetical protein